MSESQKKLEHLIAAVEKAAWSRSWKKLQAARQALRDGFGIDIEFQLRKHLEESRHAD